MPENAPQVIPRFGVIGYASIELVLVPLVKPFGTPLKMVTQMVQTRKDATASVSQSTSSASTAAAWQHCLRPRVLHKPATDSFDGSE